MRCAVIFSLIAILILISSACSSTSTPSSSPAPASSSATSPTSTGGTTWGQSATAGKTVFSAKCTKCHGDNGQGVTAPAIIGNGANLGKYNTAQGLLDFISQSMPFDAPGSLARQDYLNVVAFLLTQNNYVSSGTAFDANQLGNIQLKK